MAEQGFFKSFGLRKAASGYRMHRDGEGSAGKVWVYDLAMASSGTIREVSGGGAQRIAVEDLASHLATLEAELSGGRAIELVRGGVVVAEVRAPIRGGFARHVPQLKAQMKAIFGDEVLDVDTAAWVAEGRDRDLLL